MAVPSVVLIWAAWRFLPEPARGGQSWIELGQEDVHTSDNAKGEREESGGQKGKMQAMVLRSGTQPRKELVLDEDPTGRSLWWAIGYLLKIPTYRLLVIASALGYYFFAGVRSFGMIYLTQHWGVSRSTLSALVVVVGIGAIVGVIAGGRISGWLLQRGRVDARIAVP